ncbi:MAG: hypothetical protein ABH884_02895 [Candidatus Komeilibacteria bacterium]
MKKILSTLVLTFFILMNINILPVFAITEYETNEKFNGNLIISDRNFTDSASMSLEQIQAFLESKGTLGTYVDPGVKLPASFIIYNTAKTYGINPKVLMTLLQKEQSLIEDDSPSQKQYDWATGFTCYAGQCNEAYRGFNAQVKGAAKIFMINYWPDLLANGCSFTNWCVGQTKTTQDSCTITPLSKATAALYTYNPYRGNTVDEQGLKIGANYNFWKIWDRWFGKSYPDGSLVMVAGDPKVYLLKDGQSRWITSYATLVTRYNPEMIIEIAPEDLADYAEGPPIKFPLYALVKTPNGSIYLIADEEKRMIVSWEVFRTIGFNPEEVEEISFKDLAGIPSGKALTLYDAYPTGALLEDSVTKEIYYVESGIKQSILAPEIIQNRFSSFKIQMTTTEELAQYETSEPAIFKDGTLVKASDNPQVFVISNGNRRPINSEQVFDSYGYKWNTIIETSPEALALHPLGEELTVIE